MAAVETEAHRRSAPTKKLKSKPRSKQPQKVKFVMATEIRCTEKSKGGLSYEVILAEPISAGPPKRPPSPNNKSVSSEEIEGKLKAAQERRLSLEANKMAQLAAQLSKIEEASKKKDEQANQFIIQTKEALDQKMEVHVGKREAYISDLKSKLKDHLESVEKTRLSLEQQTAEVRNAVEEKLKTAAAQRDENLKKMMDRLKEHEENAQKIRSAMQEKVVELEQQIKTKLSLAQTRRENMEKEQMEKLRNHNVVKLAEVRQALELNGEIKKNTKAKDIEDRLTAAEQNRSKEILKRLESIKRHERRAEMVRQNKERLSNQNEQQETASSG